MPAIRLTQFQGIAPAVAPHLLADNMAQIASNCRLTSGDLEPLRSGELEYTSNKTGTIQSVFHIAETAGSAWLAWEEVVSCVKGPISGVGRYYFTGANEPRMTTRALATSGGGDTYPNTFRALGLPKPVTAPTVSPSGGVGAAVSRYYTYTFYDDMDQESANAPLSTMVTGKVDDTWAISGMNATPPNSGDITALTYTGSSVTITTTNTHFNRVGETVTIADVTTVTNVNGTWVLTAVNIASKTMTFTVTGTPAGTYNNGTDTTDTWTRVAPFGTCTKRLYRTSGSTAQFQLVAEGISGTTYNDTLLDSAILGDELISASWDMPPVDLAGLFLHPSGALVGYSGNELCFSEPYQPHAWPPEYRLRTDYAIKGVGFFGATVGIATAGAPYIAMGSAPGQMILQRHADGLPCVAPRSVVSTLYGVVYASADGLVQIDDNGAKLITSGYYDHHQWAALVPASMLGGHCAGVLYYTAQPAGEDPYLLVFGKVHTRATVEPTALYVDAQDGLLYYVLGSSIYAFDRPGRQFLLQDWQSKDYILPAPATLTAAKVMFDTVIPAAQLQALQDLYDAIVAANAAIVAAGETYGEMNAHVVNHYEVNGSALLQPPEVSNAQSVLSFTLYVDGELKYSTSITDNRPFRLPSGYKGIKFSVRVTSTCRVRAVELADNVVELKRV